MKLRTAVTIFVVLVLGLFAALSISLVRTSDLLERGARNVAIAGESIRIAEELKSRLLTHNRNAFLYSLSQDPGRLETRRAQRVEIANLLSVMTILVNDREEEVMVDELKGEINAYFARRDRLYTSALSPVEQFTNVSREVDEAIAAIDELTELNRLQMRNLVADVNQQNRVAGLIAVSLLSLGGTILLVLIVAIVTAIARPLARLTRSIELYGAGESTARAELAGLKEIREIASNFNAMADRLEARRQDQLYFIASIAHDLRNPLHSISLTSQLLAAKSSDEDRELANVVLRQVNNLDHLVLDLLDTSRIEAGQLDLQLAEHDVNDVVRDAVALHRGTAELHQFTVDTASDPVLCRCDRSRLSQVLNNLLSNAVKYSPNGGAIRVTAHAEEESVVMSVSDQGIGIALEDLDNIFKPFHRTKLTRGTIPGIGLGLSASRRIVEAHGGSLEVESVPDVGSTFRVVLPCHSALRGEEESGNADHGAKPLSPVPNSRLGITR
ncbi:MAG: ATP-binding protein [Cellvibrionaceae bacterium]